VLFLSHSCFLFFLLACVNCTSGFIVIFPYMYTMYFDQIHLLCDFLIPLSPLNGFIMLVSYMYMKYFSHVHFLFSLSFCHPLPQYLLHFKVKRQRPSQRCQWLTPVIPSYSRDRDQGSWFETSPGK
jgi:hypothetical protein